MQSEKTKQAVNELVKAFSNFAAACQRFSDLFAAKYAEALHAKEKAGE